MDGLSGAASVVAIIDISAKITSLCYQYFVAVKGAKIEIERLQKKVADIERVLKNIKKLLDGPHKARLPTTHNLFESLEQCSKELKHLEEELEPGKTRKVMSRVGLRALKWPFTSKKVEMIISSMEGYEHTFTLALQADQAQVFDSLSSSARKNS